MIKLQSPLHYYQGPGLIRTQLGPVCRSLSRNCYILASQTARKRYQEVLEAALQEAGVRYVFGTSAGDCTSRTADRICGEVREAHSGVLIGVGAGKAADTAKLCAFRLGLPVVIVPTAASCDGPCSSFSVLYNDAGMVEQVLPLGRNPDYVLADSQIIADGPPRLLAAGIGDALSTYFETRVCCENGMPGALGAEISLTGMELARLCCRTLLEDGANAMQAAKCHSVTPALEHIIEANLYLSSVGFESGGLSCAHAVQDALTALPDCRSALHGEKVAFGVQCLLAAEKRPLEEQEQIRGFCHTVGLPVTLAELGLTDHWEEKIASVISIACPEPGGSTPCRVPPGVTPEAMGKAIREADARGRHLLAS